MTWQGALAETVALLDLALVGRDLERRIMFGLPAYRLQGNMFAMVYGEHIVLRLGPADRQTAAELWGDPSGFEIHGRRMREYVRLPESVMRDAEQLEAWLQRALAFVALMPARGQSKTKPNE